MFIEFKEKVTRIVADVDEAAKNYVLLPVQSRLNMICSCPGRACRHAAVRRIASNELCFDAASCLDAMEAFLGYQLTSLPEAARPELNYSGVVVKNLINHLKVLALHSPACSSPASSPGSLLDEASDGEWATCHDTFSGSYDKLQLNLRLAGHEAPDADYCYRLDGCDRLLKRLDGLEPKRVLEETQLMIGRFDLLARKPQALLQRINKALFGGEVTGLVARWGNCQRYIAELDVERTCSGRVHMVLKLNKLKKERPVEVVQVMMIEMAIFFLNKSFASELRPSQLHAVFTRLQDAMGLILVKLSNLTQLDLTRPYGIDRILVYTFQVRADERDRRCQHLLALLAASSPTPLASANFQLDLFYLLPYLRKDYDTPCSHSHNVFAAPLGRAQSPTAAACDPFDIEPRQAADASALADDPRRISGYAKALLQRLEADLTASHDPNNNDADLDDLHDYVQLSSCGDGLIHTTDLTRIEHRPHAAHLLHTPPGTSRSFETSTRRRVSTRRRAQPVAAALSDGLRTWRPWIEQLQAAAPSHAPPAYSLLEADSGVEGDVSAEAGCAPGVAKCRHSLMTLMGLLLKNRAVQPASLRGQLCGHLADGEALGLEAKVQALFGWLDEQLFFGLLRDVRVEWSYRLKSTAACTVLEKEPCTRVVIRLAWNLLSRLQMVEIAKMLLHEMIHAFLGLAIGDFCERHDLNYTNILGQINYILKLNIPIEHDYEETMELAYVWKCNKCAEKRVRFYNVPPTELQKEKHALKCDGSLLRSATPRIFRRR